MNYQELFIKFILFLSFYYTVRKYYSSIGLNPKNKKYQYNNKIEMSAAISCIYMLYDDTNRFYIGKTQNLNNRLICHRNTKNTSMSRHLSNDFKYIIIKETNDEEELCKLEQSIYDYFKSINSDKFLNKKRPLNTQKEYYIQNKNKILTEFKKYRQSNKQYFQDYYMNNIKDSVKCDICDYTLSKYNYEFHLKSKKHNKNNLRTEHI